MNFAKVMDLVSSTGKRSEKEKFLKKCDERCKAMLVWSCDPIITFGVTVDEGDQIGNWKGLLHVEPALHDMDAISDVWWMDFDRLLKKLSVRELSGNAAKDAVQELLECAPTCEECMWASRVINKNLRAGFTSSTIGKVFPGLIEPFAVALAKPYDPEKHDLAGHWTVEPKLDGLRMVVMDGIAYTRNGRVIETVGHIIKELGDLCKDYVFDGEVMGAGDFDEASGSIRRKSTGENTDIYYNVFDVIKSDQWASRKTARLEDRQQAMHQLFNLNKFKYVKSVKTRHLPVNPTTEELFAIRDEFMKEGYEGAMLKNLDATYCFKRSSDLLKLKDFLDADGEIVAYLEGRNKYKGALGAFMVSVDGVISKVGSGFTDEQRHALWKDRDNQIGKWVEVVYQNKTADGSLRFPTFKKFRPDKE